MICLWSVDYLYLNYNLCQLEYAKMTRDTGEKNIIPKEELKQKLELSASSNYEYTKDGKYFNKKYSGTQARSFIFEVEPGTFNFIL